MFTRKTTMTLLVTAALAVAPAAYSASAADAELQQQLQAAQSALDTAAKKLAELHKKRHSLHGKPKKAMLGILLGDEPSIGGVPLVGTTPKGGAAEAGIKAGDKIVRLADVSLADAEDPMGTLVKVMRGVSPGESVAVTYERNGEAFDTVVVTQPEEAHILTMLDGVLDNLQIDIAVDLDDIEQDALEALEQLKDMDGVDLESAQAAIADVRSRLRVMAQEPQLIAVDGDLARYFGVDAGVVVVKPQPESELKGGDVLLEVNGNAVDTLDRARELLAQLDDGVAHKAKVRRNGSAKTVTIGANELAYLEPRIIRIVTDKD